MIAPFSPRSSLAAQRILDAAADIDAAAPSGLLECWPTDGPAGTVAIEVELLRALRRALQEAR